jgi:hypothetical protein
MAGGIILSNRLRAMQDAAANFGDSISGIREAQRQAARQSEQDKMVKAKFDQEQQLGDFQLGAAKRKEEEDAAQGLAKQDAQGFADDITGFGQAVPESAIGLPGMQSMQSPRPAMDQTAENVKDRLRASMENSIAKSQGKVSALTAADMASQRRADAEKKSLGLQEFNLGLDKTRAEIESTKAGTVSKGMDAKKTGMEIKKLEAEMANLAKGGMDPDKAYQIESGINNKFIDSSKPFIVVRDAWNRIKAVEDTPAGDVSMVYSLMKILDPGASVMEGDIANARNTAGVSEKVRNVYNNALSGRSLDPKQRSEFRSQANSLFLAQKKTYDSTKSAFEDLAIRYNVDPSRAVMDLSGGVAGDVKPENTNSSATKISTKEEWAALPSGTSYVGPDGKRATKK